MEDQAIRPGSLALRSVPQWRVIANEQKVSDRIPLIRFEDARTLVTKNGDLARVFRLGGIVTETLAERQVLAARDALANLYRQHGRTGTAFYLHTIRRRLAADELPTRPIPQGFPGYVEQLRRAEFSSGSLAELTHTLTVLQRPMEATGKFLSFLSDKTSTEEGSRSRVLARRRLDEVSLAIETLLARLGPEALTKDDPRLTGFLSMLVNGRNTAMRPTESGLDLLLPTHRPIFRGETLELRGSAPEDRRFIGMLALKAYGDTTHPAMLDAALSSDAEFILTQSFVPREVSDTLARMKWTRRKMLAGEDEARSLAEELDSATDAVASGREIFGDHQLSLAVLSDSEDALAASLSDLSTVLTSGGLRPTREDIALEALWWAQLPGNMAYRARTALISAQNFADLAPCHSFAQGQHSNLTWGAPIALLETQSGTPFHFNFHGSGQSANGNTLIFGPSGAGKTALIGFLMTSTRGLPKPPRIFAFDKDRGMEAAIRALGGSYSAIHPEDLAGFNPFKAATDVRSQAWLRDWIATKLGRAATPRERRRIAEAVTANAIAPENERRFQSFAARFGGIEDDDPIALALDEWHSDGAKAWLFDSQDDSLDLTQPVTGFDMTAILRDPSGSEAFIDYAFHQLDRALESGEPTLIVLDEAWRLLKSGVFAAKIEDWLKTVRKLNGAVVFLTQEPEDAARSEIAPAIVNSTMTKIFFPNETASEPVYREVFGLTEREFELIRSVPRERRSFLVKQGGTSSFARLDLGGTPELIKVFSGTAQTVHELARLRAEYSDDWLSHYMEV